MSLRFLVVEDDAASREFARSNLSPFGIVDAVQTLAEADVCCAEHTYALLLLDVSLPDGQSDAWLTRQRALGNPSPAVALTAELALDQRRRLLAGGFVEALGKPLAASELRRALAPWLGLSAATWCDAQALSALGGSEATLQRMRELFLDELPRQRARALEAIRKGDIAALRAVLHQLRAGCGFVGAMSMLRAVDALHAEPENTDARTMLLGRIDEILASQP